MASVELNRVVRSLPCGLTRDELLDRGEALSKVRQEIDTENDRQAAVKRQLKATLEELEARSSKLVMAIGQREEYRDVTVVLMGDGDRGIVVETRVDTGEVVAERRMTDAERAQTLPFDREAGQKPAKKARAARSGDAAGA